jgi:diguanylate cyclase (GGDEF)-like protein
MRSRERAWVAVAVAVVVLGVAASAVGAWVVANREAESDRRRFEVTSAEIGSTLELAIERQEDLTIAMAAFFADHPDVTNQAFYDWLDTIQAFERFPELRSVGFFVPVAPQDVEAFAQRAIADAIDRPAEQRVFEVLPPGDRPFYCFMRNTAHPGVSEVPPLGLDLCEAGTKDRLLATRDNGGVSYEAVSLAGTSLGVQAPVYRGGVLPPSVAEREVAFLGWLGILVDPQALLTRALDGHPGVSAQIHYRSELTDVTFALGTPPDGAEQVDRDLGNGWVATMSRAPIATSVTGNVDALVLLLAGSVVSLLLGAVIVTLATSRGRAERLVRQRTDELRYQALHDGLTGLANRTLVADRVEQLLARSARSGFTAAALYLDLDGFKLVNDTHGHDAGDHLLKAVAERLLRAVRGADTIGRMGGDEFVVLLDASSFEAAPELVAQRLIDVLHQPFELTPELTVRVSTSIGVATHGATGEELLRHADLAMYEAKAGGRDGYAVFRPEMGAAAQQDIELESDLRNALANQQLRLVYQPVYNLEDLTLASVEALLRWDHPTLGVVLPDDFIPILERNGTIVEVGAWVLREACRQAAEWHSRGSDLTVSVNVSARQLDTDAVIGHVTAALRSSGLDPTTLVIEITESALMRNPERSAERIAAIRALGVRVAIDDFGTGYSSLAYLRRFPVDSLKIDRSFLAALDGSSEGHALMRTIVQLGKDLGLRTLAEGVETVEQVDVLRGDQIDEVQGFVFARPMHPSDIEATILSPLRPSPQPSQPSQPGS